MSLDEEELRRLLLSALDNEASAIELSRLNDLLRNSEALRRSAARFLGDDSLLQEEVGTIEEALAFLRENGAPSPPPTASEDAASNPPVRLLFDSPDPGQATPLSPGSAPAWRALRVGLQFVNNHGLLVAAASVVFVLAFYWHYASMMSRFDRLYSLAGTSDSDGRSRGERERQAGRGGQLTGIARVTGLVDCEWLQGEPILRFGDQLTPGQRLRLERGRLQLTYEAGAKVTIEGPADFTATMPSEAKLGSGKIAAVVPRAARGYTILTPTAEVVDLGTEFGVSVENSGTEVHVFDGDVVTRAVEAGVPQGELIHARKNEAVRFDVKSDAPTRFSADQQLFVRRVLPAMPEEELPPLPITEGLSLWLAADVIPGAAKGEPVSTWPDVLIGDNQFPDDAWQFDDRRCPIWMHDDKGRPAVRFDGWSTYMSTSPMETGDRQTAFVVFAPSPASFASSSHGGMLLKYGLEAPTLEIALQLDHSPRGLVWARDKNGDPSNVGVITGAPVKPFLPCAVAYCYDAESGTAELMTDGKSQGTADAPRSIAQRAKKYIGSHAQPWYEAYFLGNLYEVIIYDRALGQDEREQVFEYLSERYQIPRSE